MANKRRIEVELGFQADTSKAKQQIEELNKSLSNIAGAGLNNKDLINADAIKKASQTALELQKNLRNAFNVNTGKLDIFKFANELKKSGKNITQIRKDLVKIGPDGENAFRQLTQSIANAESSTISISKKMESLLTTLKNTVKWQISSNIIHRLQSGIQKAYGYAQDLNESLNKIRIVTGESSDQMARFAQQANKAAKQLSTTTTAYTNAALIFYQQGLTGEDVTKRTDTVIKMANVTGESASEVSSYMTAIWNNFADGSDNLEHFADVITALGAATASSSAEISQGLEKFAAIGKTVGLSYEYATSALATVVSETRQSADIVGTAFKTIFSRLQGLQLGETLEDGLDLNKYSKALDTVGVKVLDTTGQMRKLDDILDDLAGKWGNLTNAQQTALAQTVAGTRQYSQLMALMNSWDKMKTNLNTANNAEGTLQAQADIYAESWEAAQKRVKAAAQDLYTTLINDEFFIKLTDGFKNVIEGVKGFINGLGGIKGLLLTLSSIFMQNFAKNVPDFFDKVKSNVGILLGKGNDATKQLQTQAGQELDAEIARAEEGSISQEKLKGDKQILEMKQALLANEKNLTNAEIEDYKTIIELQEKKNDNYIKELEKLKEIEKESDKAFRELNKKSNSPGISDAVDKIKGQSTREQEIKQRMRSLNGKGIGKDTPFENLRGTKNIKNLEENFLTKIDSDKAEQLNKKYEKGVIAEKELETFRKLGDIRTHNEEVQEYRDLIKEQEKIKEEKKTLTVQMKEVFGEDKGEDLLNKFIQSNGNTSAILDEVKNKMSGYAKAQAELRESFEQSELAVSNWDEELKDSNLSEEEKNKKIEETKKKMQELLNTQKSLAEKGGVSELFESIFSKAEEAIEKGDFTKGIPDAVKEAFQSMAPADFSSFVIDGSKEENIRNMLKVLGLNPDYIDDAIAFLKDKMDQQVKVNGQKPDNNSNSFNPEHETKAGEIAGKGIAAAMQIGGFVSSMENLTNAFDESTTAGQKFMAGISAISTAMRTYNAITDFSAKLKQTNTIATWLNTKAENINKTTKIALTFVQKGLNATLLAGAAILGIAVLAVKLHQKALENEAKAAQMASDAAKKHANELEEEAKNAQKVVEEYDKLTESYDKQEISLETLRAKTYSLAMQYGQTEIAIKAMSASYEELNNLMKESAVNADEAAVKAKELEKTRLGGKTGTIETTLKASIKSRLDSGNLLDLGSWKSNDSFRKGLEDLNIDTSGGGHVNIDSLIKQITEGGKRDELLKLIEENSNNKTAQQLAKVLNGDMKQYLDQYEKAIESQKELVANEFLNKYKDSKINTQKQYQEIVNEATQYAIDNKLFTGKDADKQAREWAQKSISAIDEEFAKYGATSALADKIFNIQNENAKEGAPLKTVDEFAERLSKYSAEEQQVIADYIERRNAFGKLDVNLDFNFDEIKSKLKNVIELVSQRAPQVKLEAALVESASGKPLSSETVEGLFKDTKIKLNVDKDTFQAMDVGQQQTELLVSNVRQQQLYANNDDLRDAAQRELKAQEEDLKNSNDYQDFVINKGKTKDSKIKEAFSKDSWLFQGYDENTISTYKSYLTGDISEEEFKSKAIDNKKLDKLASAYKTSDGYKKLVKDLEEVDEKSQKLTSTITDLESQIANLETGTIDYIGASEKFSKNLEEVHKVIDKLQNAYKTAASAIAEYNEMGYFSIDSVQSLIDLGPEYLQYLVNENGELDASSEALEAATQAQLKLAQANWENAGYTQLMALAEADLKDEVWDNVRATYALADAENEHKLDTLESAKAMALLKAETDEERQAVENLYKAYKAGSAAYQSAIDNPNFGSKISGSTDKKDYKKYGQEFDRFYPINKNLENISDTLTKINNQEEFLFGADKIAAIDAENEALAAQATEYEHLYDAKKSYLEELQDKGSKYNVIYTADGDIDNYGTITKNALDRYNAAVDTYNSSNRTEVDKKAFDLAQKDYEEFKQWLSNYQSTISDVEKAKQQIDESIKKSISKNLEKFKLQLQLDIDVEDARRTLNEFLKKTQEDFKKAFKTSAEITANLQLDENSANSYQRQIQSKLNQKNEVDSIINNKNYDYNSQNAKFHSREEAIKYAQDLSKEIMSDGEALFDLYKSSWDGYLSSMDEVIDRWDDVLGNFEDINEELEHYSRISELLFGGDETAQGREYLAEIYEAQKENSLARQETLRVQKEAFEKEKADLLASGAKETDNDVIKLTKAIEDADKNMRSEIENYLDTIKKQLENAVKTIKDTLDKNLFGGSISDVKQEWEDRQKQAEGYYDEVEKIYQLESLQTKWNKAINDTTSLKTQKQLTELMDRQQKILSEKTYLSELDVELAEKELSVYQAQIALEEAQNNKNSMKMVRDGSGNWSYQYVADEDDIAQKQQDVADRTNEWRESSKAAAQEVTENTINAYEEFSDRMSQIYMDVTLSEEEREEKVSYLNDLYFGPNGILTKAGEDYNSYSRFLSESTYTELWTLYAQDAEQMRNMTNIEKDMLESMKQAGIDSYFGIRDVAIGGDPSAPGGVYGDLILGAQTLNIETITTIDTMATDFISRMATDEDSVKAEILRAYSEMEIASKDFEQSVHESTVAIGIDWANVTEKIDENTIKVQQNKEKVDELLADTDKFDTYRKLVDLIGSSWSSVQDKVILASQSVVSYAEELKKLNGVSFEPLKQHIDELIGKIQDLTNALSVGNPSYSPDSKNYQVQTMHDGLYKLYTQNDKGEYSSNGNLYTSKQLIDMGYDDYNKHFGNGQKNYDIYNDNVYTRPTKNDNNSNNNIFTNIIEKIKSFFKNLEYSTQMILTGATAVMSGFDTGGYTGDWNGGDGRLAILHSKELVLNAEDTKNMLATIEAVRDLSSAKNSIQDSIAAGLRNMLTDMVKLETGVNNYNTQNNSNATTNVFNINPSFPNAANVNEIREALLSLPNLASQYLSQNKK